MARVFIDGFELASVDHWENKGGTITFPNNVPGQSGAYCLHMVSNLNTYVRKTLPAANEYYVAIKYRPTAIQVSGGRPLYFYNGSTVLAVLSHGYIAPYYLQAKRSTGTLLATATTALSLNTWNKIEVRYKPDTVNGIFQVKLNGVMIIDFTGNTTAAAAPIDAIQLAYPDANGTTADYDDFIVDNAAWIGDTKIQALLPSGAGNSAQWTPSAGANWDCLEEIPPSDTDFNATGAADNVDLFAFGDLVGSIDEVKCVQVQARAKYEGAPAAQKLQLGVRSGGANYFSASKDLTTVSQQVLGIWEQNPATSAPWTPGGVNDAEFGYKSVT